MINKNHFVINTLEILPKEYSFKELDKNLILIYKINYGRGNSPRSLLFPKQIVIDETFVEACALYLGDGKLGKDSCHLHFVSKDRDIAKFMLNFFIERLYIKPDEIRYEIFYKKRKRNMIHEWAKYLNIPPDSINARQSSRHKEECFNMQIGRTILRLIFEKILQRILNKSLFTHIILRRAFLRGIFAAEGNVGIDYLEKKPYISQITFSLNINEVVLKNTICKILKAEGIRYRIYERKDSNCMEIIISNWKNYWKLWKFNLFDLCERKKIKFLDIMRNLSVYCIIENKTRINFLNSLDLKQREIAKLIKSWQSNISHFKNGNINITIDQIILLQKINKFSIKELKRGITKLRVGSLTEINEKEFLDFMWDLKATKSFGS